MNKSLVNIKGLHCHSCEILTQNCLLKIPGVTKAIVNRKKGTAEIFSEKTPDFADIEKAVNDAGYQIGKEEKTFITKDNNNYIELTIASLLAFILLYTVTNTGVLNATLSNNQNYTNLSVVFLIGLTAGLSTCMALVGGIVLGLAAKYSSDHPEITGIKKLRPHLKFNLGRIISFFILGGLIGMLGSIFQISASFTGLLIIFVSLIMIVLGLQLINIFPLLNNFSLVLPKKFSHVTESKSNNAFLLGALTFFLPCGFTQTMQAFSISSQNPITASLTMGVFAIGTTPGLLGVGALTSFAKGQLGRIFFKFAGIIVILMALFNISNGLNLTGISLINSQEKNVQVRNNLQIVRMAQKTNSYEPNAFTIKRGVPVKWIINSQSSNSCARYIMAPDLGIKKILSPGENIFEFTPVKLGKISFFCAMGMYSGYFNVVD